MAEIQRTAIKATLRNPDDKHSMKEAHEIPLGPAPLRRPQSLRRTSSVQAHGFESLHGPYLVVGHARDLYSGDDVSSTDTVAADTLRADISAERLISSIEASRCNDALGELVSVRLGGKVRKIMTQVIPEEVAQTTLLHLLLDDMVAASIISNAAPVAWGMVPDIIKSESAQKKSAYDRTGTCISFTPGSRTLLPNGQANSKDVARIPVDVPIENGDPQAWHPWNKLEGPNQMRLRRMDLWKDGGMLQVDAGFQDSAAFSHTEQRMVFHEYGLQATIEPDSFIVQRINVQTGILPFMECLQSAATAQQMVGQSLLNFRRSVPAQLPGVAGCTHLNDVMRSLQDVATMAEILNLKRG